MKTRIIAAVMVLQLILVSGYAYHLYRGAERDAARSETMVADAKKTFADALTKAGVTGVTSASTLRELANLTQAELKARTDATGAMKAELLGAAARAKTSETAKIEADGRAKAYLAINEDLKRLAEGAIAEKTQHQKTIEGLKADLAVKDEAIATATAALAAARQQVDELTAYRERIVRQEQARARERAAAAAAAAAAKAAEEKAAEAKAKTVAKPEAKPEAVKEPVKETYKPVPVPAATAAATPAAAPLPDPAANEPLLPGSDQEAAAKASGAPLTPASAAAKKKKTSQQNPDTTGSTARAPSRPKKDAEPSWPNASD